MCEALLAVRQRTRGPLGSGVMLDRRPACFSGKAADDARPRRLRVRWRSGEEPFTWPSQRAVPR
jgi:hypothetical protein